MDKVRIGIIGTGYIGNVHGQIYSQDARAEVSALFDIIPERAEKTAKSIGGKVCRSREELFENCDAVLVTTPNKTHVEIASDAVAHEKHVFCEKPFAIGIENAKKLLEKANSTNKVFQVGHNRRFAPVYVRLKELISNDNPHSAHIKMNRGELKNPVWTGDTNVTGGFLYETTIHLFDMCRHQFGEIWLTVRNTNIPNWTNFQSSSSSKTAFIAPLPQVRMLVGIFRLSESRFFAIIGQLLPKKWNGFLIHRGLTTKLTTLILIGVRCSKKTRNGVICKKIKPLLMRF
jgi:predicted dehydrogenase